MEINKHKIFVKITAEHDENGIVRPTILHWKDGRNFIIDKVYDVRRAAALKAGGTGWRYNCLISGKQVYLFDEDGRWFVEGK